MRLNKEKHVYVKTMYSIKNMYTVIFKAFLLSFLLLFLEPVNHISKSVQKWWKNIMDQQLQAVNWTAMQDSVWNDTCWKVRLLERKPGPDLF